MEENEVQAEEQAAAEEQPVVEEAATEPTEKKCGDCGETKPASAFYRITKGGKLRSVCKDCYDLRYYGRKHGVRPAKQTANPDMQAAIEAVVETLPEDAPAIEGGKKKKSGGKKKNEAPVVEAKADEVVIEAA